MAAEEIGTQSAQARKRRIERRSKLKVSNRSYLEEEEDDDDSIVPEASKYMRTEAIDDGSESDSSTHKTSTSESVLSKDDLSCTKGFKKGARYVPEVPMTKQQLTLWRKEARRVRNRESAAASRQKTRKRIEELECEVANIKSKYSAALRRILELELAAASSGDAAPFYRHRELEKDVSQAHEESMATPSSSPFLEPHTVSPPLSPRDSFLLDNEEDRHNEELPHKYQHVMNMISRPNA